MTVFQNIWDRLKSSPSIQYPNIAIMPDHILDEEPDLSPFDKDKAYFEIRIKEQFLQNGREYWNEYIPLSVVLTELIYADQREAFPFVVGPALLKKLEQVEGNEHIRYRNTRVLGPTPYGGDQISLFTGLFRMKTKDWALQAVSLLEGVAKSFDATKLSNYVNIAKPLTEGLENFLGMGENMELRIGHRLEFSDPSVHDVDQFMPGYWLMLRNDDKNLNAKNFWVKGGQLFYGAQKNKLVPFTGSDYILYHIAKLPKRSDYTTFEFHKQWKEVHKGIWSENLQAAKAAYHVLISSLRLSPDLIESQKNQLQAYYLAQLKKEMKAFEEAKDPFSAIEATPKSILIGKEEISKLKLSEKAVKALKLTDSYLKDQKSTKGQTDDLEEESIQKALDSEFLQSKEILDMNADEWLETAQQIADNQLIKH